MTTERPKIIRDPAVHSANAYDVFRPHGITEDSDLDTLQECFFECMEDGLVDDDLRDAFGLLSAAMRRMLLDLQYFDGGFVDEMTLLRDEIAAEAEAGDALTKDVPMSWES